MKLYKNMEKIVVIAIEILYYPTNKYFLAYHVDIT